MEKELKAKMLLSEVVHNYMSGYDMNILEYTITKNLGVINNTDLMDNYIKVDIVEICGIITVKLNFRLSLKGDWVLSPTMQLTYNLGDDGYPSIVIWKGEKKMIEHMIIMLENAKFMKR